MKNSTHLVGTLSSYHQGILKNVLSKKLKQKIIIKENQRGITILKWSNKRDISLLSMIHITKKREQIIS